MSASRKVYVQSFGCQMNVRDAERVIGLLGKRDFALTESMDEAQVVILNTCSVRQHAEDKIFGRHGELARLKKTNPETLIGIMGCMAQEHGADFFKRMPVLDFVCGPGNLSDIPELIDNAVRERGRFVAVNRINDFEYAIDGEDYRSHSMKALVNIMSGCDHRCTYCIVPMTRGIERSRPAADVIDEVRSLVDRGYREVMLLGQNVNGYGKKLTTESVDFADLLLRLDRETGIDRLRFITSHPKDASDKLFAAMAEAPSVCEHLHLPVQSGSDAVLRRMKREHTRQWYEERVSSYRRHVPHGSLTTDIIVGFPQETEEDYQRTRQLIESVRYDSAFIFKYSPRPQTPAYKLKDDVPEEVKHRRLQELLELQRRIALEINSQWVGRVEEVLFEGLCPRGENQWMGRTRSYKRVVVNHAGDLTGKLLKVRVKQAVYETLLGELHGA